MDYEEKCIELANELDSKNEEINNLKSELEWYENAYTENIKEIKRLRSIVIELQDEKS